MQQVFSQGNDRVHNHKDTIQQQFVSIHPGPDKYGPCFLTLFQSPSSSSLMPSLSVMPALRRGRKGFGMATSTGTSP